MPPISKLFNFILPTLYSVFRFSPFLVYATELYIQFKPIDCESMACQSCVTGTKGDKHRAAEFSKGRPDALFFLTAPISFFITSQIRTCRLVYPLFHPSGRSTYSADILCLLSNKPCHTAGSLIRMLNIISRSIWVCTILQKWYSLRLVNFRGNNWNRDFRPGATGGGGRQGRFASGLHSGY